MKSIGGASINKLVGVSEQHIIIGGASTNKLGCVSEPILLLSEEG